LVPYKKIDIVIEAFNQIKKRLLIIGTGSEEKKLKSHAGENIEFLGLVDDSTLAKYYARAKALIFPQTEDFGLTPLEAAASGTPTLAYSRGGVLETVLDGYTGLFFAEQTPDAIINTIHRFENGHHQISAKRCRERALEFAEDRFMAVFSATVNSQWQKHQKMFS
jgi:glycosyltransferase involved in cell wall biosynthesis